MTRDQFMSLSDQQKWDALLLAESERDDFERQLNNIRQASEGEILWPRPPLELVKGSHNDEET